ncbi:MAG: Thiol peroxidase, Bcp-type, partial [uncultured Chloroflexia bacterium]
ARQLRSVQGSRHRGLRGKSRLSQEPHQVPQEVWSPAAPAGRPRPQAHRSPRRMGREELYGQDVHGCQPLDLRGRAGRHHRASVSEGQAGRAWGGDSARSGAGAATGGV